MTPCANVRPLSWDSGRCACGSMVEAHARLPVDPVAAFRSDLPERLAFHIAQDRDEATGALWQGLDVTARRTYAIRGAARTDFVTVGLSWDDEDPGVESHELTLAQAEQLRDALTEILDRAPAKQDPKADAEEDAAYRVAIERMEAAEAREDAADALRRACDHSDPACARCYSRRRADYLEDLGKKAVERANPKPEDVS